MQEQKRGRSSPQVTDLSPDDEAPEVLSRAAREAVRQPADPRLERSFAHLGTSSVRGRSAAVAESGPPTLEVQQLREQVSALQASLEATTRRLDAVMWALIAVAAVMAVVAILALAR